MKGYRARADKDLAGFAKLGSREDADRTHEWANLLADEWEAEKRRLEARLAEAVKALAELVRLKDGPRDDVYRAAKDAAWDTAREVVRNHDPDFNDETQCDCGAGEHEPLPLQAMTDERIQEILEREALSMGRACELIDAAIMAHDVIVIVYRPAPIKHGDDRSHEIRTATYVDGRPKYSTIVSTRWSGDGR